MKKTTLLFCLALLLLPFTASAYAVKTADSVYVPKTETIEGNLYAAGANVTVEGKVNGDVICAGQAINISGEVAGDVICAGQTINITGNVGGSVRAAGNSININGKVSRNVMAFGAAVLLSGSSNVGWDALVAGANIDILGKIAGDLHGAGANFNLAGEVGKNVSLKIDNRVKAEKPGLAFKENGSGLKIGPGAVINGELKYTSGQDAAIDAKAVIKGKVTHNLPAVTAKKSGLANLGWWWGRLISLFSALVIGLVLISFWREQIIKTTDLMLKKAGASFGWGVLVLLLTPIAAVILLVTIIGIPLSFILMALWLIALYLSKIFVGILIGRSLLSNYWAKQKDSLILAMIFGIIIAYIIFALPFIGWILALLAMLWGLGGILLSFKKA